MLIFNSVFPFESYKLVENGPCCLTSSHEELLHPSYNMFKRAVCY